MKNLKLGLTASLAAAFSLLSCEKKTEIQEPRVMQQTAAALPETPGPEMKQNAQVKLPAEIENFLKKHYAGVDVAKFEQKNKTSGNEYEVKLNNGVEVEFDGAFDWREIKDLQGVPEIFVPAKIQNYVNQKYKGIKIKKIEKKTQQNTLKIELLNDTDLVFDQNGNFLRIDN